MKKTELLNLMDRYMNKFFANKFPHSSMVVAKYLQTLEGKTDNIEELITVTIDAVNSLYASSLFDDDVYDWMIQHLIENDEAYTRENEIMYVGDIEFKDGEDRAMTILDNILQYFFYKFYKNIFDIDMQNDNWKDDFPTKLRMVYLNKKGDCYRVLMDNIVLEDNLEDIVVCYNFFNNKHVAFTLGKFYSEFESIM